jgi:hypothetical protein
VLVPPISFYQVMVIRYEAVRDASSGIMISFKKKLLG